MLTSNGVYLTLARSALYGRDTQTVAVRVSQASSDLKPGAMGGKLWLSRFGEIGIETNYFELCGDGESHHAGAQ